MPNPVPNLENTLIDLKLVKGHLDIRTAFRNKKNDCALGNFH